MASAVEEIYRVARLDFTFSIAGGDTKAVRQNGYT
jgi:hypothetical protein